jgi:hypothetical protein
MPEADVGFLLSLVLPYGTRVRVLCTIPIRLAKTNPRPTNITVSTVRYSIDSIPLCSQGRKLQVSRATSTTQPRVHAKIQPTDFFLTDQ